MPIEMVMCPCGGRSPRCRYCDSTGIVVGRKLKTLRGSEAVARRPMDFQQQNRQKIGRHAPARTIQEEAAERLAALRASRS